MMIIRIVKSFVYNFRYGIKNLISWLPVIWNDRDNDYYYIYKILYTKLKHMETRFSCNDTEKSNENVKEIKDVCQILERLMKDDYVKEEWEKFNDEFGTFEERYKVEEMNDGMYSLKYTKSFETQEKEDERIREITKLEVERIEKDVNNLFDTLKEKIGDWWV